MGGFSSGRYPTKVCVEDGLTLDINRLIRQRHVIPGSKTFCTLTWSNTRTGEATASIGFDADLAHRDCASIRLHYTANGKAQGYRVCLETTPCRFGGFRWWWLCPHSGRCVSKLYLPPGATVFASRYAYRMAYRSERGGPMDRTHGRQRRIYRKLGAAYDFYEQAPPPRPKGMHQRTYERLVEDLYAAMDAHESAFECGALKIIARLNSA